MPSPQHFALQKARDFLRSAVLHGGCRDCWKANFGSPPVTGSQSVFLAYFAARALVRTGGLGDRERSVILGILERARRGEAFAYDGVAPADADDTAFAWRTFGLLGLPGPSDQITRSLQPFARGDSWLTFAGPHPGSGDWAVEYQDETSIQGLHPEVHLNISCLLAERGLAIPPCAPLPLRQGLPRNYHYPSQIYAGWLAREAAHLAGLEAPSWELPMLTLQAPDGSWPEYPAGFSAAQETALALLTLSDETCQGRPGQMARAFLLDQQRAEGSWSGGVLWSFPVPLTGGRLVWHAEDCGAILATSLGILALERQS